MNFPWFSTVAVRSADGTFSSVHTLRPKAARSLWDDLAILVLVAVTMWVFLVFRDYGLTHDEEVQNIYGEKLLSWYLSGFADDSAFSYLDLFWYGGLFDLAAAILNKFSPVGVYETRHLLGGLVGVLGLAGAWRLGRLVRGPRAGFLAMALLAATPAYVGHSFNNPKDAPFAVAMIWAILALAKAVRALPRPPVSTVVGLGCAIGLALSIRVGALLLLGYAGLAVILHLGLAQRQFGWGEVKRQAPPILRRVVLVLVIAYAIIAVFWPWAVQNFANPLRALQHFSGYDIDIQSLFAGTLVEAPHLPPLYVLGYLTVTLPEMILVGLLLWGSALVPRKTPAAGDSWKTTALVALAAFFPILFFIVTRPTAYDGIRHFLFVIPPLVVLAALGIDRLWRRLEEGFPRLGTRVMALCLVCAGVMQGWLMGRLHPNEYIYYNALVGGVAGAEGQWELDYWSNSMHEAVVALADLVRLENGGVPPATPVAVAACGNDLSASYFFPPYLKLTTSLADARFIIAFTQADCWKTWRGRPVVEIERFGAVLSVVKDRRGLSNPGEE